VKYPSPAAQGHYGYVKLLVFVLLLTTYLILVYISCRRQGMKIEPIRYVAIVYPRMRCLHCGHTWKPRRSVITWCPRCLRPDFEIVKEEARQSFRFVGVVKRD
jgi:hypothetical protein